MPSTPLIIAVRGLIENDMPKGRLFKKNIKRQPRRQLSERRNSHLSGLMKILQIMYKIKRDMMQTIIVDGVFILILLVFWKFMYI